MEDINHIILKRGQKVWSAMGGELPGVFNRNYWEGKLLNWVMQDQDFRVDMFHFIDVLSVLEKSDQVSIHIKEYLTRGGRDLPVLLNVALKAATGSIARGLAARAIKRNVIEMAQKFIAGSQIESALKPLRQMHRENIGFTVDILGELTLSQKEANNYIEQYMHMVKVLAEKVSTWEENSLLTASASGSLPLANVSIKLSALDPHLNAADPDACIERLFNAVLPIFIEARRLNVFINIDLEQWEYHEIIYGVFEKLVLHQELADWPHIGIVVQAYLKRSEEDIDRIVACAKKRGVPLTVRLVKGAYWDYETVRARQWGYECPVFANKWQTDSNYEKCAAIMLEKSDFIYSAFGSHNLRSLMYAIVKAEELGLSKNAFELQMLYGMAEPERRVFSQDGYRVRVYAPIGDLLPGMSYLVRRLLENTSNTGFLRQGFHDGVQLDALLAAPEINRVHERQGSAGDNAFYSTPFSDFCEAAIREKFSDAIRKVNKSLPLKVPMVIDGQKQMSSDTTVVSSPNDKTKVVSTMSMGNETDALQAVKCAAEAFPQWRDKPLQDRVTLLIKLANALERDRMVLAAWMCVEAGKPWREADADVAEAIDFCRYYAKQALVELAPQNQGHYPGERNQLYYIGRGPCVVIAPWNFPLAILCGMSVAALVAGNPVVMKPAEQSSAIAYQLYQRMLDCGFPKDVVQFLPGKGEVVGQALVWHKDVSQIAFTGSRQVGLEILESVSHTSEGQRQLKRVVCEMGGKNAIIIDDDADIDEAIQGVIHSAFGFAGQKCSACSRLYVLETIYESFKKRLVECCQDIIMTCAEDPSCEMGPVIDEVAYEKLKNLKATEDSNLKALYLGENQEDGYYVGPALFEVSDAKHSFMEEEFFGPLIAMMPVKTFEEAIDLLNDSDYALTAGVYTRLPSHEAMAQEKIQVGNLYINRSCTGAMVGRQPFGGFRMSGLGTKAGGPGYLLNFADPKCITENTMRRGFTPEIKL